MDAQGTSGYFLRQSVFTIYHALFKILHSLSIVRTITVKVIPNAKKSEVTEKDGSLLVRVNAPASGNKANLELIRVLSDYFSVKKNSIRIIKGAKSRNKTVQINC